MKANAIIHVCCAQFDSLVQLLDTSKPILELKSIMSDKFKGKYRIKSARLQNWDYSSNGLYFVTICTANRELYFGDIVNGEMQLSEIGHMANKFWKDIPEHFPFVELDECVIMPNHVHGIIIINKPNDGDIMINVM